MNLQEEWSAMQQELTNDAAYQADIKKKSTTIYDRLRKNLEIKQYWVAFFCTIGLLGSLLSSGLLSYLLLGFGLLYAIGGISLRVSLHCMRKEPDYNDNTQRFMQEALERIERILHTERSLFLITGPLMGPFGILCTFLYKYGTFEEVLAQVPNFHLYMASATLLIIPGYFLGEYLNKIGFGNDLNALKKNLGEMEGE